MMETMATTITSRITLASNATVHKSSSSIERSRVLEIVELKKHLTIREVTLLPEQEVSFNTTHHCLRIVLPLVGKVSLTCGTPVEVGELWVSFFPKGSMFTLANPYGQDCVHFFLLEVVSEEFIKGGLFSFEAEKTENAIKRIVQIPRQYAGTGYCCCYLGRIRGREEASLPTSGSSLGFVLAGAFEYQNRLLEQGDGLWLNEASRLEMEALSTEGLIFILEFIR